jgi:winged helix DNA-binding protein
MTLDILRQRLHNQLLSQTKFTQPSQVVTWLGAVQSQDYAGAKWAVAQRTQGQTDAEVEQAFARGEILRTHVMRPTWHFVTPEDIRWMLELTASRVRAAMASTDRQVGLETSIFKKSNAILSRALRGNQQLTRSELGHILQKEGIPAEGLRLGLLMLRAELDGIICSGARRGKQHTYALLDERAPQAKTLERDEALAQLAMRYFGSHGPATLQDFVWWSGLTMKDARKGMDFVKTQLTCETIDQRTYWFVLSTPKKRSSPTVHLLQNYDEYTVAYTDRTFLFDIAHNDKLDSRGNIIFQYAIVMDGLIAGTWKRKIKKNEVVINIVLFTALTSDQHQAIIAAAQGYGKFLELPVVLA